MKEEIYTAAETGNVEFLDKALAKDVEAGEVIIYSDDDLLGLTSHGNNIIHVAAECGQDKFIEKALASIPALLASDLICGKNNDGDTPLHLAAKQETATIAQHLIRVYNYNNSQWTIQNNKGNTPLHVALMNGGKCILVAEYLLQIGPEVSSYVNHRKQTPLHLAVNYDNQGAKVSMTNMINTLNRSGASLECKKRPFEKDSLSLIKLLLETDTTVCCLRDEDGMTPLLGAALKSYVPAVMHIITSCPECVEICDLRAKNVLHHSKFLTFEQARELLKMPRIRVLIDRQDENGSTPLHLAINNYDYTMVKAMIEWNANFAIEDKEGTSPATLIQSKSSDFLNKMMDGIRQCNNVEDKAIMPKELKLLDDVYGGKWQSLLPKFRRQEYKESFQFRQLDGSNILHVVLQYHDYSKYRERLIIEIILEYPILLCQTDSRGCTPLHYAMPNICGKTFETDLNNSIKQCSDFLLPPWKAKDLHGDTILHLAVRYKRFTIAISLAKTTEGKMLVEETNDLKETPLHCLCRDNRQTIGQDSEWVGLLMNDAVVYSYDADGLTPLLRAVNSGTIRIATKILQQYPESINQVDSIGRGNMLHHISFESYDISKEQWELMKLNLLLHKVDSEGNLPIHVAIQRRRFHTATVLLEKYLARGDISWVEIKNNAGKGWFDQLRELQEVPSSFTEFLSSSMDIHMGINVLIGKSFYGVSYSNMKNFMDTLAVVAALFATITFTAALTVPGGFMTDKGTPILAKKVAFQVFMFADVVGMCSSIMALFCIVLFYTSDQMESEGRKLGDLSMGLLRLSFFATLVAFMTVVYVTAFPVVSWLAIFTLVISSLVLLLMMKKSIVVGPLIQMFYFSVIFSVIHPINSVKTYVKVLQHM